LTSSSVAAIADALSSNGLLIALSQPRRRPDDDDDDVDGIEA
jgi:hypothetical protein